MFNDRPTNMHNETWPVCPALIVDDLKNQVNKEVVADFSHQFGTNLSLCALWNCVRTLTATKSIHDGFPDSEWGTQSTDIDAALHFWYSIIQM